MTDIATTTRPHSETTGKGNRRRGSTKGFRGQPGGAHQRPWREDPIILDRIRVGMEVWTKQLSNAECLQVVNDYMAKKHGEIPISPDTLSVDRKRGLELLEQDAAAASREHLAEWNTVIREAYKAFASTSDRSLNRSALLGTISQTIERKAKLDGSMQAGVQVNIDHSALIVQLRAVIEKEVADPAERRRVALRLLEESRTEEQSA